MDLENGPGKSNKIENLSILSLYPASVYLHHVPHYNLALVKTTDCGNGKYRQQSLSTSSECGCILVHMSFLSLLDRKGGAGDMIILIARLILQSTLTKSLYFVCCKCTRMHPDTHTNIQNSPGPAPYLLSAGEGANSGILLRPRCSPPTFCFPPASLFQFVNPAMKLIKLCFTGQSYPFLCQGLTGKNGQAALGVKLSYNLK